MDKISYQCESWKKKTKKKQLSKICNKKHPWKFHCYMHQHIPMKFSWIFFLYKFLIDKCVIMSLYVMLLWKKTAYVFNNFNFKCITPTTNSERIIWTLPWNMDISDCTLIKQNQSTKQVYFRCNGLNFIFIIIHEKLESIYTRFPILQQ